MKKLKALRRKSYHELCALPKEQQIEGPVKHPEMRFFIRRKIHSRGDKLTPKGTVEISVCAEVYANGVFKMGSAPSIEVPPKGKVLDSMRGWDAED